MMILSFVALLQFGINLLTYKSENKDLIRSLPFILLVIYLAAAFSLGISNISQIALYVRYGFGFAGSALSAIMFFRLSNAMRPLGNT